MKVGECDVRTLSWKGKDLISMFCKCVTCGQQRTCAVMQGRAPCVISSARCGPCCRLQSSVEESAGDLLPAVER
jgi:hypothetical protein